MTADRREPTSLRIALVGPVAQSIPPQRSGSVETVTAMLADGLVEGGHDVTLFATAASTTSARLHSVFAEGYHRDTDLWPWELCEQFNLAAAVERSDRFDVIHYQAEYQPLSLPFSALVATPLVQTVHHAPGVAEVALWSRYPDAPFIAVSDAQARRMAGLNVVATIHHAVDPAVFTATQDVDDYLLFLGRFIEGKGVLEAIEVARRSGRRLVLAAAANEYYQQVVAPHVDGTGVRYLGEADESTKVQLLQHAAALVYPIQSAESFGLVLAEAMMCGTPVVALDRGAVGELVEEGVTGAVCDSLDTLVDAVPRTLGLDRHRVRSRALERFGPDRMVQEHEKVYRQLAATPRSTQSTAPRP